MERGFEPISRHNLKSPSHLKGDEVKLPLRGSKTSAGYDFFATEDLVIKPGEKVFFWTDVKAKMPKGEVLLLAIRSSMGVKHDLMLSNTLPVIDSDYYNNADNEGNIGISIRNMKPKFTIPSYFKSVLGDVKISIPVIMDLEVENTVTIKSGERIAQGIFVKFSESENCNSDETRIGGFGSTSK